MSTRRSAARRLVAGALCASVLAALTACGGGGAEDGKITLRFSWWGNPERAELTQKAIDLFEQKNPNIEVQPSFAEFEAYWQKMATEVSGGGGPDVLQMDYSYLKQYASRNLLLDLKPQADSGVLKLGDFRPGLAETGVIDGKQVAVPMAGNTLAMFYRADALEKAGVEEPEAGWSWDDYHQLIQQVTDAKVDDKMTGGTDYTSQYHFMELWLRQQGKSFYTEDGKLNFTKDDLRTWWNQTQKLRDANALLSAQRAEQLAPNPAISAGEAATEISWDNFLARYTGEAPDVKFGMVAPPTSNPDNSGLYLKPSMLLSVSARTEHPTEAAKLVDFLVNDPEAAKILGTNRGIPATNAALDAIELNEVDKQIVEYEKSVEDSMQPAPPPPPPGAGSIEQTFSDINEEINFKRTTVDQAVEKFFSEAEQALKAGAS